MIGGGAAGLSAALVLARARRTVARGGRRCAAQRTRRAHAGLPVPRRPAARDLLALGRDEVTATAATLIDGTVDGSRSLRRPGFEVRLAGGDGPHRAPPAGGDRAARRAARHPGCRERWGRDLLHCPYCHGYEVRDQPLGVLGGTAEAVQHAQIVRQWSADVVLFPHTDTLTAAEREQLVARAIGVVEGDRAAARSSRTTGSPASSSTTAGSSPRQRVFVPPAVRAEHRPARQPGLRPGRRRLGGDRRRRPHQRPGVWVAGNVANPRAQVITAAGEGSAAAIALNADLVDDDVRTPSHSTLPLP